MLRGNIRRGGTYMKLNQQKLIEKKHIVLGKTLIIGFFGGVFLTIVLGVFHYFSMTEINILKPWKIFFKKMDWPVKWYIYPLWIISFGVVSIIPAIGYFLIGRNRIHWIIGALYGLGFGLLIYVVLPNLLWDYHIWDLYAWKTHISMLVCSIIYGVFIGYSISYENATQSYLLEQQE